MVTDAFAGLDVTTSRPVVAARGAAAGREGGTPEVGAADGGADASGGEGFPGVTICSVAALGAGDPVVGAWTSLEGEPDEPVELPGEPDGDGDGDNCR